MIDWTDPKVISGLTLAGIRNGQPTIFVFTGRASFTDVRDTTEADLLASFDQYAALVRGRQAHGDMLDEDISPELREAVATGYRIGVERLSTGAIMPSADALPVMGGAS